MTTTSAVSSSTSSTSSTSSFGLATAANAALGESDFLKLLVAQMKNQDPLSPQDNTEFVAELAQFSNLEQTQGINDRLDLLAIQSRGQSNAQVASLIGQEATVKGSAVTTTGDGAAVPVNFTLAESSATTDVTISDSSGNTLQTIKLGAEKAGLVTINWDGRDSTGTLQPSGSYNVTVKASTSAGASVSVDQNCTSVVTGISYDTGYAVLQLANGVTAPVSNLVKISNASTGS
jgi:flagellar basal-body rod modification protein FlgD